MHLWFQNNSEIKCTSDKDSTRMRFAKTVLTLLRGGRSAGAAIGWSGFNSAAGSTSS